MLSIMHLLQKRFLQSVRWKSDNQFWRFSSSQPEIDILIFCPFWTHLPSQTGFWIVFFLDLMFEEEYFKPQDDKVTRWKNYKMKRWQVEMWQDDKMTGWQDEKKTRWQYDKKTRWQDGKMGVEKGEFVYKDLLIWNPRQILRVPQSM